MTVSIWKFFIRSSHAWFSYIRSHLFVTSRVYYDPTLTWQQAPSWLVSSVGRALHRYRRGHELKSHTGLNISQHLFSLLLKKCSLLRRSLSFSFSVICALSVFFFPFSSFVLFCKYSLSNLPFIWKIQCNAASTFVLTKEVSQNS